MKPALHALRFPLELDASLGRLREENDYDAYIQQLIRQVLLTAPGERIQRPDFGAGLRRLLFGPASSASASMAQALVLEAMNTWLGRYIRTESVVARAEGETLFLDLSYVVLTRQERRFLSLEIKP